MHLLKSSLGKKYLMALSGLVLFGFILGHLAGNLLIYAGPDALNAYAKKLVSLGPVLYLVRAFLLACVVIHIWAAIGLVRENRLSKPIRYKAKSGMAVSMATRTMTLSGLVILAFIIYHLLHFTFGVTHPEIHHLKDHRGHTDVYTMVIRGFQVWPVALSYIIAIGLLCLHLSHGVSSTLQTLGLADEWCIRKAKIAARIIALVLFLGYGSIPLNVWFGILKIQ